MSDLTAFAKRYAEARCSQNPDAVAAFYAEDGVITVNGGTPAVGRAGVAMSAKGFMMAFPDLMVTFDSLRSTPQGVEFHWTLNKQLKYHMPALRPHNFGCKRSLGFLSKGMCNKG